jgi:NADH:ubiquinone oxidoreductase subunit 6 (subunit J)
MCLNAFSGSVFLTVGILHLLPHVEEYEAAAKLSTDYPVGLACVVIGFVLVLFVELVLFGVHGSSHRPAADKDVSEDSQTNIPLLERSRSVFWRYQDPLITEAAVLLHAVLECITVGLAVRTQSAQCLWCLDVLHHACISTPCCTA